MCFGFGESFGKSFQPIQPNDSGGKIELLFNVLN